MARISKGKGNATFAANVKLLASEQPSSTVRDVRIITLDSMKQAASHYREYATFAGKMKSKTDLIARIESAAVDGHAGALALAMEASNGLIDATIAIDPRLARKPQWTRGEDGIFADAGLVAMGDDSPCFDMTRGKLRDFSAAGERINVVISTDSSDPSQEGLQAFIATVRLVQQFRPVNVYWQGAWMANDGREAGYVFHAPLITNDMDFSRCQYVITDTTRDNLSFGVAYMKAYVKDRVNFIGMSLPASRSYLPNSVFVGKGGIRANPEAIARTAAEWLGWQSLYDVEVENEQTNKSSLQEIPVAYVAPVDTRTDEQKAKDSKENHENWERWIAQNKADKAAQSAARIQTAQVLG